MSALLQRARPWLPWISLCTGVGGALLMNRTPERAWIVVAAACAGWVLVFALQLVERAGTSTDSASRQAPRTRFALHLVGQVAMQQALLFPLPFYVRAAQAHPGHVAFFVCYAAVLVIVLWDPLFASAMKHGLGALPLQAFSSFVGLNMVLPVFGFSNTSSLWCAGFATAVAVPGLALLELPPEHRRRRWLAAPASLLVVMLARLAAPLVPPAPLQLLHVGIGAGLLGKELVGEATSFSSARELVCHSTVRAPLGLRDALVHVWRRENDETDRISVEVGGGREAGFRTWSRKRAVTVGRWTCSVETASGQVLGRAHVEVGPG